jgi:peptidoglycan/xylan/chitin deacetylase (PgdA/CDA1 family)
MPPSPLPEPTEARKGVDQLAFGLAVGVPAAIVILIISILVYIKCQRNARERLPLFPGPAIPLRLNRQIVALIIDCGPSDKTAKILDLLRDHHGRATFFVTCGEKISEQENMLKRIREEGHELGIHPLRSGGVGSIEGLKFAELEGYIKTVEEQLDINPNGEKYVRLTAVPGSEEYKKADNLIRELGYILVRGESLPVVVPDARINAGMVIQIIGREDETIRQTKKILNRLYKEKLKAATVGKYLEVAGEQGGQTPGLNGTSIEWIANWPPQSD